MNYSHALRQYYTDLNLEELRELLIEICEIINSRNKNFSEMLNEMGCIENNQFNYDLLKKSKELKKEVKDEDEVDFLKQTIHLFTSEYLRWKPTAEEIYYKAIIIYIAKSEANMLELHEKEVIYLSDEEIELNYEKAMEVEGGPFDELLDSLLDDIKSKFSGTDFSGFGFGGLGFGEIEGVDQSKLIQEIFEMLKENIQVHNKSINKEDLIKNEKIIEGLKIIGGKHNCYINIIKDDAITGFGLEITKK